MRAEARLLVVLAAISTLGCAELDVALAISQATAVLDASSNLSRRSIADRNRQAAESAERNAEEARLRRLRDDSRTRLYPPRGPHCAVLVTRTSARTWRLTDCDGALYCWALRDGYDCEPIEPEQQL